MSDAPSTPAAEIAAGLRASSLPDPRPLVVLIVSHGWTIRNYLLGPFLPRLLEECRVVLLSPLAPDGSFCARFEAMGVRVEPLLRYTKSWLHRRVATRRTLYHFTWSGCESGQIKLTRAGRIYGRLANLRNRADQKLARVLAGRRSLALLDRVDALFFQRSPEARHYRRLFRELRPSLVFSTASVMQDEWLPLHAARALGLPVAVGVMSWDNLTSKGRLPYGCDRYVVWNERMRREVLSFHAEVRPDQVMVTGSPQFDYHLDPSLRVSRQEFCGWFGLDPRRKILVYSGVTPGLMPREPRVVAGLLEALRAGRIAGDPQMLVRLHPVDDGGRYESLRSRYPEAALCVPGRQARGDERRLISSLEDIRIFVNTLVHGDVHLNVASTVTIDAAVLDRPVVNIRYEPLESGEAPSPGQSLYEYTHYRAVVAAAGARIARSVDEVIRHVEAYLGDPRLDRDGRARIVQEICGSVDGCAQQRTADLVAAMAGERGEKALAEMPSGRVAAA